MGMDGKVWNVTPPPDSAPDAPARLNDAAVDGRKYVRIAAACLIAADVVVSAVYMWRMGFDRVGQQSVRLAVLCLLAVFLLQGKAWARWTLVVILFAAVFAGLGVLTRDGAWTRPQLPSTLPMLALVIGYVIVMRGLIYSTSVRAFFAAHGKPQPADDRPPFTR
jgi:hypothetical protein